MTDRAAILAEIARDPSRVRDVSPEDAPGLLAQVSALGMALAARVLEGAAAAKPASGATPRPQPHPGHWLTPDEAAAVCGVTRRQVYSWSRRLEWRSFTRRLSRKALRIEEAGLRKWLNSRLASSTLAHIR